jgi:hypothetical protein
MHKVVSIQVVRHDVKWAFFTMTFCSAATATLGTRLLLARNLCQLFWTMYRLTLQRAKDCKICWGTKTYNSGGFFVNVADDIVRKRT